MIIITRILAIVVILMILTGVAALLIIGIRQGHLWMIFGATITAFIIWAATSDRHGESPSGDDDHGDA